MAAPPRTPYCRACERPASERPLLPCGLCNWCSAAEPLRCIFALDAASVADAGKVRLGGFAPALAPR